MTIRVLSGSQPSTINKSSDELLALLNHRAEQILGRMDKDKEEALAAIRSGQGTVGRGEKSEADFLQQLERIRKLFILMHNKNIEAIKNGQYTASHEITSDIHYLLYIQASEVFGSAYYTPGGLYSPPVWPKHYKAQYPGTKPKNFGSKFSENIKEIWSTPDNMPDEDLNVSIDEAHLRKIESQLKQME